VKLGINVPYADYLPREMVVAYVQEADKLGYDTVWVAEAYGWDAFTICTQLACSTERIKIGTGIVNVFSRSPALIAQTAGSLDLISNGRFILGLGTSGHQVIEGWHGVKFERGVHRMRETIEIVRMVLKAGAAQLRGRDLQARDGPEADHPPSARVDPHLSRHPHPDRGRVGRRARRRLAPSLLLAGSL